MSCEGSVIAPTINHTRKKITKTNAAHPMRHPGDFLAYSEYLVIRSEPHFGHLSIIICLLYNLTDLKNIFRCYFSCCWLFLIEFRLILTRF